jgi:predicted acyl esterase
MRIALTGTAQTAVATEVTGCPNLAVWSASSATDGELVVSLDDAAPDGRSR